MHEFEDGASRARCDMPTLLLRPAWCRQADALHTEGVAYGPASSKATLSGQAALHVTGPGLHVTH